MTEDRTDEPPRRALLFILLTIVLDATGLGIIIPVTPELIMELTGEGVGSAARYGGWLIFVYALMQFFFAPVLGNLSDRYGRRPILLGSLAALAIDYTLMGFAPTIVWLFIGRVVAGIAGATAATAHAYIADVTSKAKRSQSLGLVGASWGVGFIVGPAIGGLLGEQGARVPFFVAAGLAGCNLLYGAFVVPESLARSRRRAFSFARSNPAGALASMRAYPAMLGLITAQLLYQIAHDANPAVWTYYTIAKFNWSERDVGWSLAFVGVMVSIVQGGVIRVAIAKLGERRAVYTGLLLTSVGFMGFAFATEGWMMYALIVPFSLGSFAIPALRGIMTKRVPEDAQGELQGAVTSMISLTTIVAPMAMTQLFGYFSEPGTSGAPFYFPGAPFLAASVLAACSVTVFAIYIRRPTAPAVEASAA